MTSSRRKIPRTAGLAAAAAQGSRVADFLCMARLGADPRGVHGSARAVVHLPSDFQAPFLALPVERHVVWGEETFPENSGRVAPDAPGPALMRSHGIGGHVVPGVGHLMMVEDPAATAKVPAPIP